MYYPFGEARWTTGTLPTDFSYTGQRDDDKMRLLDYHARFYDPYLSRFVQADTIVPEPGNPQYLNRYSYVANRPLQGGDPTGHQGPVGESDVPSIDPVWSDWLNPDYSDWYGGRYGGCFMCHAGGGRTPLTNKELATADSRMRETALQGTVAAGSGVVVATTLETLPAFIAKLLCGDGDCFNELSAGFKAPQPLENAVTGGGGVARFGPGFTGSERNAIESVAARFSQIAELDISHIQFWRYGSGTTGYAASGSRAGISFFDDFFSLSGSRQLYVFAEEYLHVLQGLTEFNPDTATAAHQEITTVLELLLSLQ